MADLETTVSSILEELVNAAVSEISKNPDVWNSSEASLRESEDTNEKEIQLRLFMAPLARVAAEKISRLFLESSSALQQQVSQGAAEVEELRRKLEVVEMQLMLESGGPGEEGEQTEGVQLSESCRAVTVDKTGEKRLPIIHLWEGKMNEDNAEKILVKVEETESPDSVQLTENLVLYDGEALDHLILLEDPDDGDPDDITGSESVLKLKPLSQAQPKGGRSHSCGVCGKAFTLKRGLRRHQRLHADVPLFGCEVCGKSFYRAQTLKLHKAVHTRERTYKCQDCGKSFTIRRNLQRHQRIHTGEKPFMCQTCGKSFNQSHTLKTHLRIHTGEKPFMCQTCGKSFKKSDTLKTHLRIHTGERPFSCETCGKSFIQKSTLKTHQKTSHTEKSSLVCVACGDSVPYVHQHLQTHAASIPCACRICGQQLYSFTELSLHQQQHTTDRPVDPSYLKIHCRTDSGERPFTCEICGRTFTQHSTLKTHQVIHTGEKPFSCNTCGKSFNYAGNLSRHQRIHTGEKPFSCKVCGRSFNQGNSLKSHLQIHTGQKLYSCQQCGRGFSDSRQLKKHTCERS